MANGGQTAASVTVPDTKLAREATELVRESTTDLVYNHSRRVFWFGSLQGRTGPQLRPRTAVHRGDVPRPGPERGVPRQRPALRGGQRRRSPPLPARPRRPEDSIRRVWTAIALHTTPGIPEFMEPEVALVTAGVEYDVLGIGYHDISDADRAADHRPAPAAGLQAPASCRRSPTASRPSRIPRSATSMPTSWSASSPASSAATSWTSSRTPTGRNKQMGITEKVARSTDPTSPAATV